MGEAAGAPLTRRQSEVRELVRRGWTNAEIAAALRISIRTAESHVEAVLHKLGVERRTLAGLGPAAVSEDHRAAALVRDLPSRVRATVEAVAVLGEPLDPALVAAALDRSEAEICRDVTEAVLIGVLVRQPGCGVGIPDAVDDIVEAVDDEKRTVMHARAADRLRAQHGDGLGDWALAGRLARHLAAAGGRVDPAETLAHCLLAGDLAAAARQYAHAAAHYATAVDLLAELPPVQAEEFRARLGLGSALQRCGDPAGREHLLDAAGLAERQHDWARLVEAVLALVPAGWASRFGRADPVVAAIAERALEAISAEDGAAQAQLRAVLAADASVGGQDALGRDLIARALFEARGSRDESAVRFVLPRAFWVDYDPDDVTGRQGLLDELVGLARRAGDVELETYGRACRFDVAVEAGDLPRALADLKAVEREGLALGQPFYAWLGLEKRAGLAQLSGDLSAAERLGAAAVGVGRAAPIPAAESVAVGHLALVRLEQGRAADVIVAVRSMSRRLPGFPVWRALLAWLYADAGRQDEARRVLSELTSRGLDALPRNNTWRAALHAAARAAILLGDHRVAAEVYALLQPSRGTVEWFGGGSLGPSDLILGELAVLLGDQVAARGHLADACEVCRAVGARRFLLRAEQALTALPRSEIRSRY